MAWRLHPIVRIYDVREKRFRFLRYEKIVYGVIVALCGLFIAPDVEAQAGMAGSAKETVAQDKFYPIEVTDMPKYCVMR